MSASKSLPVIRAISRELRHVLDKDAVSKNELIGYIVNETRHHDVTDERTCRPKNELIFLAETYHCYLSSQRQYKELFEQYHSKDKTTAQAAHAVGLQLPETYSG